MTLLILGPVLIPLVTGVLGLATQRLGRGRIRPNLLPISLSVGGGVALLANAVALLLQVQQRGILIAQPGNWPAPFGITLVADLFSTLMVCLAAIIGLVSLVYAVAGARRTDVRLGLYPLLHFLLMGINGAFLTGDLFNLYVWFEVMLIASFVLLALGGAPGQLSGAMKYVTLNLIASTLFLVAAAIAYDVTGTLNLADLAVRLPQVAEPALVRVWCVIILVAFGIKSALFPLYFWLPDAYPWAPLPALSLFILLSKVGVYAITRLFTLFGAETFGFLQPVLLVLASLTMVAGVVGAAVQTDLRRILAFHSVSQIGYMLLGAAWLTPLAVAAAIFYLAHYLLVKVNLFLISGILAAGQGGFDLARLGGWFKTRPLTTSLFFVAAFSLAGLPPFSGFWAKLGLLRAGLELNQWLVVAVTLVVSLGTLYSMTKTWTQAFWQPAPQPIADRTPWLMLGPAVVLAGLTLGLSLSPEPWLRLVQQTAQQLLDPALYIRSVLGGG